MSSTADAAISDSGRRARVRSRGRWVAMAVGMGALLLFYAGWQLFRWPDVDRRLIGDVFVYPVGLAAGCAAVGASRRCAGRPQLRSAWRLLAVASIVYLAGDVAQTVYECQWPSVSPQLRPSFLPTGGHVFSPLVATNLPTIRFAGLWCFRSGASLPCRRSLARGGSCLIRR
jgi:hypothetical protein